MKILLIIGITFLLFGCSSQYPPPEEAIKACIEAGGQPIYLSNTNKTTFTCEEKDKF